MGHTSDISKRLTEFIKSIGKPVSVFETELGLSNGFVAKTNEKMQKKTRQAIQQAYPQLNMDWLFTGEGERIRAGYNPVTSRNDEYIPQMGGGTVSGNGNNVTYGRDNVICLDGKLLDIIQKQQEQIGKLISIIEKLHLNGLQGIDTTSL